MPEKGRGGKKVKALVLFDVDGTLTQDCVFADLVGTEKILKVILRTTFCPDKFSP